VSTLAPIVFVLAVFGLGGYVIVTMGREIGGVTAALLYVAWGLVSSAGVLYLMS
jgi:hypothetical protein